MLRIFEKSDGLLDRQPFIEDEALFNPIHRFAESGNGVLLSTPDEELIAGYSSRIPMWIWNKRDIDRLVLGAALRELCEHIEKEGINRVIGFSDTAAALARIYHMQTGKACALSGTLEAFVCLAPIKHSAEGRVIQATYAHAEVVSGFCRAFAAEILGEHAAVSHLSFDARDMIDTGNLYLYEADGGKITAMANLIYRSPRHGRINSIYTAPEHRRSGYASALVFALCDRLFEQRLIPMLYTDSQCGMSRDWAVSLGFESKGSVDEIILK